MDHVRELWAYTHVIPQSPSTLCIRIVVVLVLIHIGGILSPSIERGHGIRPVKVDRAGTVAAGVDESHDSLATLLHHESGSWRCAIVPNKSGLTQVRVDLCLKGFDLNLIEINRHAVQRVSVGPVQKLTTVNE